MEKNKLLPHSVEAEQSVLGCLLLDASALGKIADLLTEDDFYRREHRLIYRQIMRLSDLGKPVDVIAVADALGAAGENDKGGGMPYLTSLMQKVHSPGSIRQHGEIVHERSIMRKLAEVCANISLRACNPAGYNAAQLLSEAEDKIIDIAEASLKGKHRFTHIPSLLSHVVKRIETLYKSNQSAVTGTATGFTDLDHMTSGLKAGDLTIVAGRPSMGTAAFAINIAEHIALDEKLPVAIFSMETGASQLAMRMLGSAGRINQHDLRSGRLQDDDWPGIVDAVTRLNEAPIYIDESISPTALEMRARARCLHRQHGGLGLIVVDALQSMSFPGSEMTEDRATGFAKISRSLKLMAMELHVPVIALLQLSCIPEKSLNKRPAMSDLHEFGAIEQDADLIMFIHREEVYDRDSFAKGKAEIIIGKQRNGPIGKIELVFSSECARFDNLICNYP